MEEEIIAELNANFAKAFEALKRDLLKIRTGRASISMLDGVRVDYYGTATPLNQMATLAVPDPHLITVKPWDKSQIREVEKAITRASLGITPIVDGDLVRLPIPPLSEERRKDMVKQLKVRAEDAKVVLRNHRRDANEMLKETEDGGDITEDDLKKALERVQVSTDDAVKKVDELITKKEKEVMEI